MIKYGAISFQPNIKQIFRNAMQTTISIFNTTIQKNNLWITSIYHL